MLKILVIKLGALGDIVMATSLIRQIQAFHKDNEIWLLTTPLYKQIFENHEKLNTVAFERKGLIATLESITWIRKMKFDRVYDLQSNDRTNVLVSLSGIPERVGNHPHYPYNFHPVEKYTGQCHIYDRMLDVLKSGGINASHDLPFLPASDNEKRYVADWLSGHHLSEKTFVIIHAGASSKHPEKRWPYYQELATILSESGYTIIWAGSESDIALNEQLSSTVSFTTLAELGRHAKFAITNDSGPMHILSSSRIPVYALFGPTNWRRCHAIGQVNYVIAADIISDTSATNCDKADIKIITVEIVLNRLYKDGHITKKYETRI
jgi:ADP-heptose:LPS heptosyltransferase